MVHFTTLCPGYRNGSKLPLQHVSHTPANEHNNCDINFKYNIPGTRGLAGVELVDN